MKEREKWRKGEREREKRRKEKTPAIFFSLDAVTAVPVPWPNQLTLKMLNLLLGVRVNLRSERKGKSKFYTTASLCGYCI